MVRPMIFLADWTPLHYDGNYSLIQYILGRDIHMNWGGGQTWSYSFHLYDCVWGGDDTIRVKFVWAHWCLIVACLHIQNYVELKNRLCCQYFLTPPIPSPLYARVATLSGVPPLQPCTSVPTQCIFQKVHQRSKYLNEMHLS